MLLRLTQWNQRQRFNVLVVSRADLLNTSRNPELSETCSCELQLHAHVDHLGRKHPRPTLHNRGCVCWPFFWPNASFALLGVGNIPVRNQCALCVLLFTLMLAVCSAPLRWLYSTLVCVCALSWNGWWYELWVRDTTCSSDSLRGFVSAEWLWLSLRMNLKAYSVARFSFLWLVAQTMTSQTAAGMLRGV